MKSEEGKAMFMQMMAGAMGAQGDGKQEGGMVINEAMMKMLGSFTVLRLLNMAGTAGKVLTKEEMLGVNAMLNKIKKCD